MEILPKLEVGNVNDPLEREADTIADRVMRMPAPSRELVGGPPPERAGAEPEAAAAAEDFKEEELTEARSHGAFAGAAALPGEPPLVVQRKCASCEVAEHEELRRSVADELLTRKCQTCEDEALRTCGECSVEGENEIHEEPGASWRGGEASSRFAQQLRSQVRMGGRPLPDQARSFLESRLGVELGHVRFHADTPAGLLASRINARAFTLRNNIFFAPGQMQPTTHSGMRLLAHEVAHTLQANGLTRPLDRLGGLRSASDETSASVHTKTISTMVEQSALRRSPDEEREDEDEESNARCGQSEAEKRELDKVDKNPNKLLKWVKRVDEEDLRFDRLRSLRARRARRVCLATACGRPEFVNVVDDEIKNKLACYDEAHHDDDELRGICSERLGAECAVGTPPPPVRKRKRLTEQAIGAQLHSRGLDSKPEDGAAYEMLDRQSVLVAELVRAKHRTEYALGQTRILKADYEAALAKSMETGKRPKLMLRSRTTQTSFEAAFGEFTLEKLDQLIETLRQVLRTMERGWNTDPSDDETFVPRIEGASDERVFEACKYNDDELDFLDCMSEVAFMSEEEIDDRVEQVQLEHAAEAGQVKEDPTTVSSVDKTSDSYCASAGGYHGMGRITVCVDSSDYANDLNRAEFGTTILHEYFHKVLDNFELDVYSASPLYRSVKYLQSAEHGALALRNPDSLAQFVLDGSKTGPGSQKTMPQAGRVPREDDCDVRTVMFSLGLAYEWLRLAEVNDAQMVAYHEMYPTNETKARADKAARRLEVVRPAMDKLSIAGDDSKDLLQSGGAVTMSNRPETIVVTRPPTIEVLVRSPGDYVTIRPAGSKLKVTVGPDFISKDLEDRVKLILAELKLKPGYIEELRTDASSDSEYQLIAGATLTGDCS
ncbi:hypothetical protein ENSA7_56550 [Enhygromyxa salina]|uniref:eCIS core domain-containing protein n=2 Tax=Enhygromyxa salina TaxID=215803 RepID=A0A2S9YA45_9BACT|nr:hypothetical protein ENSA7_56550 [Enhygromyxa salina]